MLSAPKSSARLPRKWTIAEDQKLREQVEAQMIEGEVKDWCRIAAKLPGRTNKDCRKRWHNSVAGGLKKGQWARSEDEFLASGVQKFGQRWTLVAEEVGSRSADQCAKRWQQSLDPELDRSEWRDHEDKVLIQAVQELGRHWKDIQHHHFPGRSKNCIKNRYTVLLRRFQNQGINPFPETDSARSSPDRPAKRSSPYLQQDDVSFPSSMYEPSLIGSYSSTQVSTPESNYSFLDEDLTSWPPQESFNIPASSADFSGLQRQTPMDLSTVNMDLSNINWASWPEPTLPMTAVSMDPAPIMTMGTPIMHAGKPSGQYDFTPYSSHGSVQQTLSPAYTSSRDNHSRLPTSSPAPPRSSHRGSPSYQDPEAVARFMKYTMQTEPPYRTM